MANVKVFDETFEEYDRACETVRKENEEYLKLFEADLTEKGLSPKTIKNHISNVDLFINDFLLREDAQPIETGIDNLDPFFYFYIHKCMWSTPASVRSMAAGLKKFYKCMAEHEKIEEDDYVEICEEIKESLYQCSSTFVAFHATFDTIFVAVDERQQKHPSFSF